MPRVPPGRQSGINLHFRLARIPSSKVKALSEVRAFRSEGNGPLPLRVLRSPVP